jgi:DNA repair protein RecO
MAYQTYITEALVCGSRVSHTSDRSFLLFTREAGMLYATAKSVREERSKQRYALQEFSCVRATLVHGKSGWRVAGVEPLQNLYSNASSREVRACIRSIIMLLRRVMQGETPHITMFDQVMSVLSSVQRENSDDVRRLLSLYILHELGYVSLQAPLKEPVAHLTEEGGGVVTLTEKEREECESRIEHALEESQL